MIHFTVIEDVHTPYGIPRWIHQLPSILGSRMAEEFNMEFFNTGGVPPALIVLQGGVLGTQTRQALESKTGGMAFKKNRIQILEVEPAGGTIDSAPNVRVHVERFGQERQQDSMFEAYDDKCETRVRRAFRLPPIFVGAAQDYSFATAFASYTVAEAQVFKPERDEFDEQMSQRLLPAMGYDGYRMKSKPLNIEDATLQMQGIEVAMATDVVDPEDVLDEVNKAVGINLKANPARVEQLNQKRDMDHALNMNPEVPGEAKIDPATGRPIPTQATRPSFDPKDPLKGIPLTSTTAGSTVPSPKGPTGKGATTVRPPKAPKVKPPGLGNVQKGDLAFVSEVAHLMKFNHNHEPAGSSKGGQFASGEGSVFFSPNTGNLDFPGANEALASKKHEILTKASQEIDAKLGIKAKTRAVIGAWEDGAEDSIMSVSHGASWDQLVTAGAMKGFLANQKQVLVFQEQEDGDHSLMSFGAKGSMDSIHKYLLDNGLPFHTLEPTTGGAKVHVYAFGEYAKSTIDAANAAAQHFGSTVEAHLGKGEFLGTHKEDGTDAEQRADARQIYEAIIGGSGHPDSAAIWQGIRDAYAPKTGFIKSEGLKALALDTTLALRKRDYASVAKNLNLIASLDASEQAAFNEALADLHFIDPAIDYAGMAALATLTASVMSQAAE